MIQSISKPERVYIGSATDLKDRERGHFKDLRKGNHNNGRLQNHFNKYGEADLVFEVIESGEYVGKNHLLSREQGWFDPYKSVGRELPYFNVAPIAGSQLGIKRTEEQCKKNGERFIGHIPWNKGKTGIYSEEALKIMGDSSRHRVPSEYNRKRSSEANIGNKHALGYKCTESEIKRIIEVNSIPIFQYSLDMVFIREWPSGTEAAKVVHINARTISSCLVGKLKTAGGFIWKRKIDKQVV